MLKIEIDRSIFKDILFHAQVVTESLIQPPSRLICLEAKKNKLVVTRTDLSIFFEGSCQGKILTPGRIILPFKETYQFIKASKSKSINLIEKKEKQVQISTSTSQGSFEENMKPGDFPLMPEFKAENLTKMHPKDMSELIGKAVCCIGRRDFKKDMVKLEKKMKDAVNYLCMVRSDGYRLSYLERKIADEIKIDANEDILIPAKALIKLNDVFLRNAKKQYKKVFVNLFPEELISIGIGNIGALDRFFVVKKGKYTIAIRLLETSRFPEYRRFISKKYENHVQIERKLLLRFLKDISKSFTRLNFTFSISESKIYVRVEQHENSDKNNVTTYLPCTYIGKPTDVMLNPEYLLGILERMDSNIVDIGIQDSEPPYSEHPCLITGDMDTGFIGIIMPMRKLN